MLRAIAPKIGGVKAKRQAAIIAAMGPLLPEALKFLKATTPLRIAHFLAQLAHESDGFCAVEEYASGAAYEGREDLGNVQKGDGARYKGRGPIQLTGRDNYARFTAWMRSAGHDCPDFVADPEAVATWPWAMWAAVWYWSTRSLNVIADRDDLVAVTKIVNGGRNGLADRAAYLGKAKTEVARIGADILSFSEIQSRPVLRRGMKGEAVETAQRALAAAGHYLLTIDEIFGPGTEGAVKTLQRARGLVVDGIIGRNTWAAIEPYIAKEDA
ncbi:peptidoglycan-binding protein [Ensifer soli]|uniref:peptidoglycan-binding protein n=1 Tax=Ciceribacter sp. sgz301302 TaxID=3342379 RepID=UPI0035BADFFE